jgi:hypothetical protein
MPGQQKSKSGARKGGNKKNTPVNWNRPMTNKQKAARTRREQSVLQNQTIANRQPRMQSGVPMAVRVRLPTVGMSDLMQHRITWVTGTIYVGNGTLGAANSVYLANQAASDTYVAGTNGGFWVPFAPADADLGTTYAASIMKLYRRLRIRKAKVHLLTVQSSTTNNAVVAIAPCRGPPGAAEIVQQQTNTAAAQTLQNLMSISGMDSCDSFENLTLDLTPYIAGGAGAQQNEFAIANSIVANEDPGQTFSPIGVVPCAFQVAGNSTVSALQGTVLHNVVCEMVCDLLDFVGAVPVIDPSLVARGLSRRPESTEEKRGRLLSELSVLARDDKLRRDLSPSPVNRP